MRRRVLKARAGPARPPLPAPTPCPCVCPSPIRLACERQELGWDPRETGTGCATAGIPSPGPRRHPRFPRPPSTAVRRPALPGAWHWTLKTQKGWTLPPRADHAGPPQGPWRGRGLQGPPARLCRGGSGWGAGRGTRGRGCVWGQGPASPCLAPKPGGSCCCGRSHVGMLGHAGVEGGRSGLPGLLRGCEGAPAPPKPQASCPHSGHPHAQTLPSDHSGVWGQL